MPSRRLSGLRDCLVIANRALADLGSLTPQSAANFGPVGCSYFTRLMILSPTPANHLPLWFVLAATNCSEDALFRGARHHRIQLSSSHRGGVGIVIIGSTHFKSHRGDISFALLKNSVIELGTTFWIRSSVFTSIQECRSERRTLEHSIGSRPSARCSVAW